MVFDITCKLRSKDLQCIIWQLWIYIYQRTIFSRFIWALWMSLTLNLNDFNISLQLYSAYKEWHRKVILHNIKCRAPFWTTIFITETSFWWFFYDAFIVTLPALTWPVRNPIPKPFSIKKTTFGRGWGKEKHWEGDHVKGHHCKVLLSG